MDDKVYTIDDYMKLDDGNRYELIGGKLIMVPRARDKHQDISLKIASRILIYLEQNPIGRVRQDMDVHLKDNGEEKVVGPDVFFVSKDRLHIMTELYLTAAPDLVVEILSPSTEIHDRKTKSKLYFQNGVQEYWIVDPQQRNIEVFVPGRHNWELVGVFDSEDVLTTRLLPGLEINLKDIFA